MGKLQLQSRSLNNANKFPPLDQEHRLPGQLKTFAAFDISACNHVVYTNHVGARFREVLFIFGVRARR